MIKIENKLLKKTNRKKEEKKNTFSSNQVGTSHPHIILFK